jgi:hypothetical protein
MTEAPTITFNCTLADEGMIPIDFDQRAVFGKARPPVVVELRGHSYRSTIAIMSGITFVPLRRSNREAAGVAAGDTIEVTLTLDTAPRTVDPPGDLAAAIDRTGLRGAWDNLSYSRQRETVEAIETAKRDETRDRRIMAAIAMLTA